MSTLKKFLGNILEAAFVSSELHVGQLRCRKNGI